mmetsp:Transcript_13623/g.29187  ORF Transcript_13623/g.29187 Transcript_13623/m.29187 type:complete len:261 (-) Transcript_13623:1063-1845(-)
MSVLARGLSSLCLRALTRRCRARTASTSKLASPYCTLPPGPHTTNSIAAYVPTGRSVMTSQSLSWLPAREPALSQERGACQQPSGWGYHCTTTVPAAGAGGSAGGSGTSGKHASDTYFGQAAASAECSRTRCDDRRLRAVPGARSAVWVRARKRHTAIRPTSASETGLSAGFPCETEKKASWALMKVVSQGGSCATATGTRVWLEDSSVAALLVATWASFRQAAARGTEAEATARVDSSSRASRITACWCPLSKVASVRV